jgi:hypothetical protein
MRKNNFLRLKTIVHWALVAAMGIGFSIAGILIVFKLVPVNDSPGLKEWVSLVLCAFTLCVSVLNIAIVLKLNTKKREADMRRVCEGREESLNKITADVIRNVLMESPE